MAKISRWAITQAIAEVVCPRCFAPREQDCVTPQGRKSAFVHGERTKAYRDRIGAEEFEKRHTIKRPQVSKVAQLLNDSSVRLVARGIVPARVHAMKHKGEPCQ